MLENEDLAGLIDQQALAEFRERALNPNNPVARGMAENPATSSSTENLAITSMKQFRLS